MENRYFSIIKIKFLNDILRSLKLFTAKHFGNLIAIGWCLYRTKVLNEDQIGLLPYSNRATAEHLPPAAVTHPRDAERKIGWLGVGIGIDID